MESNPRASLQTQDTDQRRTQYLEMEEMVGYVKYNWFHKEQHKPSEDAFNQRTSTTTGMMTIMSAPWTTHEPCDNGKRKVIRL